MHHVQVTLEHALEDKSGLMMLAGAALLFYQNTSLALTDPSPVPQFLKVRDPSCRLLRGAVG